ncbi:MAG TPA: hypothetical protein VEY91_09075, partial [Candidatus Limnocylindria bacterium]|nr:hypothetical protein [Candidatus Limnocylindria bacterium]
AETLASLSGLDIGEGWSEQTRPTRWLRKMQALGGFAVPAAVRLCGDPRPVARAYGGFLLRNLPTGSECVERLRGDRTPIRIHGSDWTSFETVAEAVSTRWGSPGPPSRPGIKFERFLTEMDILNGAYDGMFDLINGVRQTSPALDAQSWDDWWNAARPAWNRWWELSGDGLRPPDREEWLNHQRELEVKSRRRLDTDLDR